MQAFFYVGSYASPAAPSIYRFRADFDQERFFCQEKYSGVENPSYVLLHPREKMLYSVEETVPNGRLCAFSVEGDQLVKRCTFPTGGSDPCHLEMDSSGRWLSVSNYTSGSLAIFQLDSLGLPLCMTDLKQHAGAGAHPLRQKGPHVHFSKFHKGILYVSDLGLDRIFCYSLDTESGKLHTAAPSIAVPNGSGPRHLVFHPNRADLLYILCELSSTVLLYQLTGSGWERKQALSALPEDYTGDNIAAAIRMSSDGSRLWISNRGHNSIGMFSVNSDGTLKEAQYCKTGGQTPRDFDILGDYLIIANQDSDQLSVLQYEKAAGILKAYPMEYKIPKPTCICRSGKP